MESDGFVNPDEVIADSEDELDRSFQSAGNDFNGAGIPDDLSSVSAFTMTNRAPTKQVSSISAFTNTAMQSRKEKDGDTSIESVIPGYTSFGTGLDNFLGASSIADRAKTRQRNTKTATQAQSDNLDEFELEPPRKNLARLSSEVLELSSDEDEFNIRPSTLKVKPKPKPKPKGKDKEKTAPEAQPDPSHSAGEPPLFVKPKQRPKPRPLYKVSHAGSATSMPPPANQSDFELPIATPSPRPPPVLHDSQLPPSDPPMSSSIPGFDARDDRIPPIVTLPNVDSDLDGPLSSPPSSLFGSITDSRKKKKKERTNPETEFDELAPSQGSDPYAAAGYRSGMYDSPRKGMPPPPTFFAGSSSSSLGRGPRRQSRSPEPGPVAPEIVDLTMLPPTIIPTAQPLKPTKVKKPRKKKDNTVVLDEDDKDDDFNPLADEGKSKEKKIEAKTTKAKGKKVKGDEPLPVPEHAQMEVVIVTKPKGRTKGKGKDKAKDKAANKEVFKSREFIEDSDGEDDPLQLRASGPEKEKELTGIDPGPSGSGARNVEPPPVLSVASKGTRPLSLPSSKSGPSDPPAPSEPDPDMPAATKNKRVSKKRKSVVDSDVDEEPVIDEEARETSSKKKRHKGKGKEIEAEIHVNPPSSKKPSAQKGKRVILSDEEGGDTFEAEEWEKDDTPEVVKAKKAKVVAGVGGNKGSRRQEGGKQLGKPRNPTAHEEDEDGDSFMDDPRDEPPAIDLDDDVEEAVKENIGPIAKSASSTAKVASKKLNHDREQTKKDTFPALYSRYEIAPRRSSLPMSELIRRASSTPGTPSATPHARPRVSLPSASTPNSGTPRTYSPYLKSCRSMLSRIAPLHPNRRTPPPPPPPPPPKKKTKKEIEREEKWEEELIDSVGGINDWACLPDQEKKELRRNKWAREMGDWDD